MREGGSGGGGRTRSPGLDLARGIVILDGNGPAAGRRVAELGQRFGARSYLEHLNHALSFSSLADELLSKTLAEPFSETDRTGNQHRLGDVALEIEQHRLSARVAIVTLRS